MSSELKEELRKIESFVTEYECSQYDSLPKFMKRRVDALKKIQLDHIKIQHQYHKELQELELKYDKLYQPLYDKRQKIVSGEHEPTDDECQLPANIVENEFDGDQENSFQMSKVIEFTEEQEKALKPEVKGLPGFWLGCLMSSYNFSDSIESYDKPVLRHLKDIRLTYDFKEDLLTYKLDFHFDENPHFSNKVLTKTYFLKLKPDEKDPFAYEGFEVIKSEGCEINWKAGKDITTKTVTVKQQHKSHDGRTREKKKEVERDSFFYFFKPPQMPEGGEEEVDEALGAIMAVDFELGEVIRQSIIPKAQLYYSGYMMEEDDEDEDDDDDSDDGYDYGSDDSDVESDESDSNEESNDSLNGSKDKKKSIKKKREKSS